VGVVLLCAIAAELIPKAATTATNVANPRYFFRPVIVASISDKYNGPLPLSGYRIPVSCAEFIERR
jgi:hypothetical protein